MLSHKRRRLCNKTLDCRLVKQFNLQAESFQSFPREPMQFISLLLSVVEQRTGDERLRELFLIWEHRLGNFWNTSKLLTSIKFLSLQVDFGCSDCFGYIFKSASFNVFVLTNFLFPFSYCSAAILKVRLWGRFTLTCHQVEGEKIENREIKWVLIYICNTLLKSAINFMVQSLR